LAAESTEKLALKTKMKLEKIPKICLTLIATQISVAEEKRAGAKETEVMLCLQAK